MSSHHIVRDEQEPALLLWQPGQLSYARAGELLEWSPRVVVHQQALAEALSWGIKLDAVWAAAHQLEETALLLAHQQPVALLPLVAASPLEGVLRWLREKNQSSLNLIADARADNFALLRQLQEVPEGIQVQVFSQEWRYSFFSRPEAQKWLPEESRLRLVAFGAFPEITESEVQLEASSSFVQEFRMKKAGLLKLKAEEAFWLGEEG
jgi:thiamine pyrophosphokinase